MAPQKAKARLVSAKDVPKSAAPLTAITTAAVPYLGKRSRILNPMILIRSAATPKVDMKAEGTSPLSMARGVTERIAASVSP